MVLKVFLLRPLYPDIGLNIRRNSGESVLLKGVPDQRSQQNTSRFTKSMENLFMVTTIDEVARVLGLDPMECTVYGTLSTETFFFLFPTSDLEIATPE